MDEATSDDSVPQNTVTTLFGDASDFAIEAGLDNLHMGAVWGRLCVWCGGHRIGDINDPHCGLYGPWCGFKALIQNLDNLWDDRLNGRSNPQIWNFLDLVLYGCRDGKLLEDDELTAEEAAAQREFTNWGRFDFLNNWAEMFDGYKSFIVHPPGQSVRVLSRAFPPEAGLAVDVSRDAVIRACTEFGAWFDGHQRRAKELDNRV